jgi:hypothetical protein
MHEEFVLALKVTTFLQNCVADSVWRVWTYGILQRAAALEVSDAALGNIERVIRVCTPGVGKLEHGYTYHWQDVSRGLTGSRSSTRLHEHRRTRQLQRTPGGKSTWRDSVKPA